MNKSNMRYSALLISVNEFQWYCKPCKKYVSAALHGTERYKIKCKDCDSTITMVRGEEK